jgi:hypothetical protein
MSRCANMQLGKTNVQMCKWANMQIKKSIKKNEIRLIK